MLAYKDYLQRSSVERLPTKTTYKDHPYKDRLQRLPTKTAAMCINTDFTQISDHMRNCIITIMDLNSVTDFRMSNHIKV